MYNLREEIEKAFEGLEKEFTPNWFKTGKGTKDNKMRAKLRSKTFQGIADAMAAQWG